MVAPYDDGGLAMRLVPGGTFGRPAGEVGGFDSLSGGSLPRSGGSVIRTDRPNQSSAKSSSQSTLRGRSSLTTGVQPQARTATTRLTTMDL